MTAVVQLPRRFAVNLDHQTWIAFRAFAHARGQRLAQHPQRPGEWTMRDLGEPSPLTTREWQMLDAIAQGMSNPQIGRDLHLTLNTVKSYIKDLFAKLEVSDRAAAVDIAHRRGLLGGGQ